MGEEERSQPEPRWLNLPSITSEETVHLRSGQRYHDLGKMYPDAPVAQMKGEVVIHRALLHDLTGVNELLDWIADGDVVIVELRRIMARETEFSAAIEQLCEFVETDLGGQLIRLGEERLLLLPAGFCGVEGVEGETFSEQV